MVGLLLIAAHGPIEFMQVNDMSLRYGQMVRQIVTQGPQTGFSVGTTVPVL
jgi:hypothetical protein